MPHIFAYVANVWILRGGWPGLQIAEAATAAGAPSFAHFAKGGYYDDIHEAWCRTDKSCAVSIAAHPCKKRKDGAPSVGMVQCLKDGTPAKMPSVSSRKAAHHESHDAVGDL